MGLTRYGLIRMELATELRFLALTIPCGQAVKFHKVFGDSGATVEGIIRFGENDPSDAVAQVRELIDWLEA
jgi:hypothetical protein